MMYKTINLPLQHNVEVAIGINRAGGKNFAATKLAVAVPGFRFVDNKPVDRPDEARIAGFILALKAGDGFPLHNLHDSGSN